MIAQRTLRQPIRACGVGLHSGERVFLTLRPAPVDSGIVFVRVDLDPPVSIPAAVSSVVDTERATTLGAGAVRIATVEHLMAALCGLGIDNARVDVSASELPIMDGSAGPFVFMLQSAGIAEQPAPKRFLRVLREVTYETGEASTELAPHDGCRFDYTLEYDHPFFAGRCNRCVLELSGSTFLKELSRARTFGFLSEINFLKARNLARGGTLENAVVVDDHGVMNVGGLRVENEFTKHKIVDALGDLYLLGYPVIGSFTGHKSGHGTNLGLLRRLLATEGAYELVEGDAVVPASLPRFGTS